MKKFFLILFPLALLVINDSFSQDSLKLEELYSRAFKNHPLLLKDSLYSSILNSNIKVLKKENYPEFYLNGSASYKSEATSIDIPIPGINIPEIPLDNYSLNLDINQIIYDGGLNKTRKEIEKVNYINKQNKLLTEIYPVFKTINKDYFGILIINENIKINQSVLNDLENRLDVISKLIENEMSSQNDFDKIQSEVLNLKEKNIELKYSKMKFIGELNLLCDVSYDENINIISPDFSYPIKDEQLRPEYKLFNSQIELIDKQINLLEKARQPKLAGFAQAGYGKPGYNMFSDNFNDYYMVGLQLRWNIFDWKITSHKKDALTINKDLTNISKQNFSRSMKIALSYLESDLQKIREQKEKALDIVEIREKITMRSEEAMNSGLILTSEYLNDLNELSRSKIKYKTYELMEQQIIANIKFITGDITYKN